MPVRPFSREQTWLLPPTLDELIPADHPARFVAAFVDGLERAAWGELGIAPDGEVRGAPGYHPRVLLGAWLYGFMTGVRSTRKLEAACQEQLPYLWLSGWQRPDHNTLWRFYQEHRPGLRQLFKRTVRVAVKLGLVDLAVQAVDGTKLLGNAARGRTLTAEQLRRLLERTEAAIADLEAQNGGGEEPSPPALPRELARRHRLRERVEHALAAVQAEDAPGRTNLTDPDTVLVKGRHGATVAGYNGQVMAAPLDAEVAGRGGRLLTAEHLVAEPEDHGQLGPLIEQARELSGERVALTLADGGYHSGPNLERCDELRQAVVMPEAQQARLGDPYHKDAFVYDAATDTYRCPQGQALVFMGMIRRPGDEPAARRYRAPLAVCRACPVRARCTTSTTTGRSISIRPDDARLRAHRAQMATDVARAAYRRRKALVELVFGVLKGQQDARRLLLRGLAAVQAEWSLLATAFNLRTLARVWQGWPPARRWELTGAAAS